MASEAAGPLINRRKSELPPRIPREFAEAVAEIEAEQSMEEARKEAGIVCSNSDLVHLLSEHNSSAHDINKLIEVNEDAVVPGDAGASAAVGAAGPTKAPALGAAGAAAAAGGASRGPVCEAGAGRRASTYVPLPRTPAATAVPRGGRLGGRSNSVDVGATGSATGSALGWVRPQDAVKPPPKTAATVLVSMHGDRPQSSLVSPPAAVPGPSQPPRPRAEPEGADRVVADTRVEPNPLERRDSEKVLWDERSGSLVDASVLGSAIEGFLTKDTSSKKRGSSVHRATAQLSAWVTAVAIWSPKSTPAAGTPATGTPQETPHDTPQPTPESTPRRRPKMVSCDAVCSTLKSLFVK
jgi:hypothetical protein